MIIEKLKEFREILLGTDYADGNWDCAIMVAWWASQLDGKPHYQNTARKYHSKLSGLRWLESQKPGIRTVSEATEHFLGEEWFRVSRGIPHVPGDLVKIDDGSVCVFDGEGLLGVAPGRRGYCFLSITHSLGGWRYNPKSL